MEVAALVRGLYLIKPTDKGDVPYGECRSSTNNKTAELGDNPSEARIFNKSIE